MRASTELWKQPALLGAGKPSLASRQAGARLEFVDRVHIPMQSLAASHIAAWILRDDTASPIPKRSNSPSVRAMRPCGRFRRKAADPARRHSKLNFIAALNHAHCARADKAHMLDPHGFAGTANACNFFIARNGEIWTSTGDCRMNGITRGKVMELCRANSIPAFQRNFTLIETCGAQEAVLTGTLGGPPPPIPKSTAGESAKNVPLRFWFVSESSTTN